MSMERTTIIGEPDAVQAATDEQQARHDRYAGAMVVAIVLVVVSLISVRASQAASMAACRSAKGAVMA